VKICLNSLATSRGLVTIGASWPTGWFFVITSSVAGMRAIAHPRRHG